MAARSLEGARPRAKQSLYDRVSEDNRNHPLERTRDWQYFADQAVEYGRHLRTAGQTPIQIAGERLDDAADSFRLISNDDRAELLEELFGKVQADYLNAKQGYLSLLAELTGETAADLERRVGA